MKRVIIPVLLCLAAMLVVLAAQNARATASMRVAAAYARSGLASLKVPVARGKCEILRAAASEVESPEARAARGAAKTPVHRVAEIESARYDTAPHREMLPVKWTRGCFADPAESSHVAWDRGKRAASNHLELLDEDSRSPARLSSPGRSRKTVFSALRPECLIDSGVTTRLFFFAACISSVPSTQAPCFSGT